MSTKLGKILADFTTQLATAIDVGGTSLTLQSATDDDGVALPSGRYFFTIDGSNSNKEHISCNLSGTSLTGIKSVSRQGVETTGVARKHRIGATVTLTDFAHILFMNDILLGTTALDSTTPLKYDASFTPTIGLFQIPTWDYVKGYVDGVVTAGAPDASITTKGIARISVAPVLAAVPIAVGDNDPRVPTQAENDAMAGSSGSPSSSNKYITEDDVKTASTASKIPRAGSDGKVDPAWLPEPVLGSVVSGENLTAGNPVYISPIDATVYKAHGFKEITSATTFTHPSTIANNKIAKLSDTQFMVLSNSSNTLTITVFDSTAPTSSVASATVSTTFQTGSVTLPGATMCRLSDTTFVVFYTNTTNNSLRYRTGSISGGTITMDTDTAYSGSPDFCYGLAACPGASNGKVVFSYFDDTVANGSSGNISNVLSYLTVATNSVTVTTTVSFLVTTGTYFPTALWSTCAFTNGIAYGLFSCSDSGGQNNVRYSYINTITSVTGDSMYTLNLESQTGTGVASAYSAVLPHFVGHNGKCYFGWATNNGGAAYVNTKTVLEISQIGCKNVYQHSSVRLGGDTNIASLPMFGNEMGVIVMGFPDATDGSSKRGTLYIQKDKIYSFYDQGTLGIASNFPAAQAWYSNLKDEIILGYSGAWIKTWRLPTPFDGLVKASVTAPAAATIYDKVLTTSGLTALANYFLKDTYSAIGDMDVRGTIPVGQALSTTLLNVKK